MSNWIFDLFTKKTASKEVFKDRDSIIPKYLKKAAQTEMETAEEDLNNDWHSRVQHVSDFVLAEQITELELAGKGASEKFNAHWQEVMGEIRSNRKKAEERLLKLVPRHSLLDISKFFDRIKKQNDKFEVAKDRALDKKSELVFTVGDKLTAKDVTLEAEVVDASSVYVVKTASDVHYYAAGDAHETFKKVGEELVKEASVVTEQGNRNVLEQKDASGSWQEVISSLLLKDLQIRAEHILSKNPTAELRVQSLSEPLFHEGETVGSATSGAGNAEILQVDKENGMYVMKMPGFPTPVRKTFESAHAGYHKEKQPYLANPARKEHDEKVGPDAIPKAKTDYISEEDRAKLVKTRKDIEDTRKELEGAQEYSRHWQDLTRKMEELHNKEKALTENKLLTPGMPEVRPLTPEELAFAEESKKQNNAPEPKQDFKYVKERELPEGTPVPPKSEKLEPEGWWGWPNTERTLKAPKKHKKTQQGFELSLTANSLTLSLPNGSFLTSVHANEQEAESEFDRADSLDSLAALFPVVALEGFNAVAADSTMSQEDVAEFKRAKEHFISRGETPSKAEELALGWVQKHHHSSLKTAEDVGTGGPNMDGTNVMVDPQRGGTNQMGMGVEENPLPFKKASDDEDVIEAQLVADMNELIAGAGGDEAVIAKAMEAGAKSREEIAQQAVKALVGATHEVDFESQLTAKGPSSSAQEEPKWEHHNKKFTAAECVPAMERALDEFLPEKEAKASSEAPCDHASCEEVAKASLDNQTFTIGENVILNAQVGSLGEGTEVRITGMTGASLVFEAVHDPKIIGITKFAKVDKQMPLEKYQWENDGLPSKFELGDHVKVSASTFLNGKSLKGREGTIREKVIFGGSDSEAHMFYLVEFDGAESTTLPGDCLKRGSTKTASFLTLSRTAGEKEHWCLACGHVLDMDEVAEHYNKGHKIELLNKSSALDVISIIVKRPDGWVVMSHDKKKKLGGPYSNKEKAEKRLSQIEMFKHMNAKASVDGKPWLTPEGVEPEVSVEHAAARARFLRDKEIAELQKQLEEAKKPLLPPEKKSSEKPCECGPDEDCSLCDSPNDCNTCQGTGIGSPAPEGKCPNCKGRGYHLPTESSLKVAVMKPNMDVAQDFLDSFKIPPTVVSDVMVQEFLQEENLHASKSDLAELFKILQSSGVEVRINVVKDSVPTPGNETSPIPDVAPQKKSSKEDPTDVEEAAGLKVGSKVKYTVKENDPIVEGVAAGTTIEGRVILMPVQHPEKDPITGKPKEGTPLVTATIMWDAEDLGTMSGLDPKELTKVASEEKVAGVPYTEKVRKDTGEEVTLQEDLPSDVGPKATKVNPDGTTTELTKK